MSGYMRPRRTANGKPRRLATMQTAPAPASTARHPSSRKPGQHRHRAYCPTCGQKRAACRCVL